MIQRRITYFSQLMAKLIKHHYSIQKVITNEVEDYVIKDQKTDKKVGENYDNDDNADFTTPLFAAQSPSVGNTAMELGINRRLSAIPEVDFDIGFTKESLAFSDVAERQRYINRLQDLIRGIPVADSMDDIISSRKENPNNVPPKIVAVADKDDPTQQLVLIGINSRDRPGLLLDISKTLIRLGLNFHRTEAMVLDGRSLSLWRCEVLESGVSDIEEIWSVLNAMLEIDSGVEAIKSRGIRVIRAIVPNGSTLIDVTASDINFREKYKCAIVAIQRDGKSPLAKLSQTKFAVGDILVLQVNDDSPLLVPPPQDYYKKKGSKGMKKGKSSSSIARFVRKRFGSFGSLESLQTNEGDESSGSRSKKQDKCVIEMKDIENQRQIGHDSIGEDSNSVDYLIGEGDNIVEEIDETNIEEEVSFHSIQKNTKLFFLINSFFFFEA